MAENDALQVEEQALHEQEQGLVQMEAQLHQQEQGLIQMERSFKKRNKALLNLASYVADQENSLRTRAEDIGPKAHKLVDDMVGAGGADSVTGKVNVGQVEARGGIVERRRELLAARMALMEEREALYAERHETLERAEGTTADLEKGLLSREREVSEALRTLIPNATELMGDDDDDDADDDDDDDEHDDDVDEGDGAEPSAPAAVAAAEIASDDRPLASDEVVSEGAEIRGEAVAVRSGSVATSESAMPPTGTHSASQDKVTRRRKGRARARTNQFRITLEAQIDESEPHSFFSYANDGADDLPGLFIATPNLLKVGREVRVRLGLEGQTLEATGIVAWRRQRGEAGGPPGMGIEILNLTDSDRESVGAYVKRHPPKQV